MNPLDALKQRQKLKAEQLAQEAAPPVPVLSAAEGETLLKNTLAELSAMASLDERQAHKRGVLPQLAPLAQAYLDSQSTAPNPLAVQVMIWLFDVNDIEPALNLAIELVRRGFNFMPDRFNRSMADFVADAVYDWANAQLAKNQPAAPYLDQLINAVESQHWALNFIVKGKLYAMAAKHAERSGEHAMCLLLCAQAEAANPDGAGVKTLKNKARAALMKTEPSQGEAIA